MCKKGFITLASSVGNYQKMAHILCESYQLKTKQKLPFAVVTDKKSSWLDIFDIIIISPHLSKSAKDKFLLLNLSPFDETIFIDSDCIIFNDANVLFDQFQQSSDVSAFGDIYDLQSQKGWFFYENLDEYQKRVSFVQDLHGGIYYFRKSPTTFNVYNDCCNIMKNYSKFRFRGFDKPSDEPVMALAMSANNCKTTKRCCNSFAWLRRTKRLKTNFFTGTLSYKMGEYNEKNHGVLLHFGTSRTILPRYIYESQKVLFYEKKKKKYNIFYTFAFFCYSFFLSCIKLCYRFFNIKKR